MEGSHAKELVQHLVHSVKSVHIGTVSQTVWRRGQKVVDANRQQLEENKTDQVPFSNINPEMEVRKAVDKVGIVEPAAPLSYSQQSILLIATEWESRHGGLSTFNRELCRALASRGKIVYCVVPEATAEEIEAAGKDNIHLIETSSTSLLRRLPIPGNFSPDIVIGHGRITGEAAKAQHEDHYPCAKRIHFAHMASEQIEWHKGKSDAAIQAESRECQELELIKGADLVAAVGPRLLTETSTLVDRLHANERPRVCQFSPGFRRDEMRTAPSSLHCLLVGRAEDEALKGIDIAARALCNIEFNKLSHKPELIIRGAPEGSGVRYIHK